MDKKLLGFLLGYIKATLSGAGAIKGKDGTDGKSAYQIAKDHGFVGTEQEWLDSLKGKDGGGELENDLIVSNPIGQYKQGDVITKGTSTIDILKGILSKTYYPTLTNPSASLTYNVPVLASVGKAISAAVATLNFNRGSINPQYTADSPYRAGAATNYRLKVEGSDITYDQSGASNNFNIPIFTRTSKGKVTITGTVAYEAGVQPKDSDGQNYNEPLAAGAVGAVKQIEFVIPFYHGVTDDKNIIDFDSLTEDISAKSNKSYSYNTNVQHMVFAYDSDYGSLVSIKDENNFETIDGWTKKTIGDKTVYVFNNATTDPDANYTFNF